MGSHSLSHSSPVGKNNNNNKTVSVDVKHDERRMWVSELGCCVNRQVGLGSHSLILCPIFPPSLTVSVDVKHDEKRRVGVRAWEL